MSVLKNPLAAVMLLAGAAGGPYLIYETDAGSSARNLASNTFGSVTSTGNSQTAYTPGQIQTNPVAPNDWTGTSSPVSNNTYNPSTFSPSTPDTAVNSSTRSSWFGSMFGSNPSNATQPTANSDTTSNGWAVTQIRAMSDVLRFDIPPAWVIQNFPQVNTSVGDLSLDGFRVPLITGTRPDDLVGTLTYYFDRFQHVQRITMHGMTSDPGRIATELQQNYKLVQQPSLGGGLYTVTWNGRPTSVLHIKPAAIITAEPQPNRFEIMLELNQPGLQYGLSRESQALINNGRQAQRW